MGVIERREVDFGESEIAVRMCALQWSRSVRLDHRQCIVLSIGTNIDAMSSKLEVVLYLLTDGWSYQNALEEDFAPGSPRVFDTRMLSKSMEYFKTLALAKKIFERGFHSIKHMMPQGYYQCLLNLERPDPINAHPNLREIANADFVNLLKQGTALLGLAIEGPPRLLALEDQPMDDSMDADEGSASDDDDCERILDMLEAPALGEDAPQFPVAPREVQLEGQTVFFDNFSHTSGVQRGYTKCTTRGHHACFKYRQVDQFDSWQECASWLASWNRHAPGQCTKQEHLAFVPDRGVVARGAAMLHTDGAGLRHG